MKGAPSVLSCARDSMGHVMLPPMQLPAHAGTAWDTAGASLHACGAAGSPENVTVAAASLYVQRLIDLQKSLDAVAAASALVYPAHRPAVAPDPAEPSTAHTDAFLAACLSAMPSHAAPQTMHRAPAASLQHSSQSHGMGSRGMPVLPALSSVLQPGPVIVPQPVCPPPASGMGKAPGLAVRPRKKYRSRFSLEEEAALVAFWYAHRFKYSVKSKILWRLAERSGVTERDAISVQKHFDHNLKHGRMRELFRTFRRKGRLTDIIDSIDVDKDFDMLPLAGGDTRSSSDGEEGQAEAGTSASSDGEGGEN